MKIGLLSDTHSYLDPSISEHFKSVDEIWHAGDVGNIGIIDVLESIAPVKAVHGNIDDHAVRSDLPETLVINYAGVKVVMTHIAGSFGRYNSRVSRLILEHKPQVLVCGHSHILKVRYDAAYSLLYLNPGACGHHGFHLMRTIVRFEINNGRLENMNVVELGRRGK